MGEFRCLSTHKASKRCLIKSSSGKEIIEDNSLERLHKIENSIRKHIIMVGLILGEELVQRDRYKRYQELLCGYVDAALHFFADDTHPPMRFSLTPPPAKIPLFVTSPTNKNNNNSSNTQRNDTRKTIRSNINNNMQAKSIGSEHRPATISTPEMQNNTSMKAGITDDEATSDYNQWLHAMKLVARLPGGMPPEFRRKLWLTLAEKYLKSKKVDWEKEEKKCFSEEWREDDGELGVQIVKDLHRTGSNLCSGPAAKTNQARLKRVLLGYARYNPEVGYCQGFNMLGALILQVMDKEEIESTKVMIYLVEGILPPGYFCGSMGGLQADMGVFRELMQCKLPRLAKHLEKLQGPVENAFEPPLTNVFTMQWFLTMFCTCLPMTCVLRVWDLVLIEGSDVLLRTALVLWSLLEERVLSTRSADDFYCKMGSFASELLNGHLIDSNSLIEKIVQLGPISDIQKLRNKHLYNITPIGNNSNIPLYLDDEEVENDEDPRLAIATVWGIPWSRRGSQATTTSKQVPTTENKERLALDISLLKKQYDKLRERQKQAHIIITTACSSAKQGATTNVSPSVNQPVNQLLMGRSAILTNQGRRIAPPVGAIPPARKPSLPTILQAKPAEKQLRRGETLHWRDTDLSKRRRDSLTWKEIKADRAIQLKDGTLGSTRSQKLHSRIGKSDSSSYSEESEDDDGSSTDTSLCDDDPTSVGEKTHSSSVENSPKRRSKSTRKNKGSDNKLFKSNKLSANSYKDRIRPKSWAPSSSEIPFMLLTSDSPVRDAAKSPEIFIYNAGKNDTRSPSKFNELQIKNMNNTEWATSSEKYSPFAGDLATTSLEPLNVNTDVIELPIITSSSQLSPMPDITSFLKDSTISLLPTPKPFLDSANSLGSEDGETKQFVSEDGVTNQYFERVISHNYEKEVESLDKQFVKEFSAELKNILQDNQRPDLLLDHPQNSSSDQHHCNQDIEEMSAQVVSPLGERDDNIPGENLADFQGEPDTLTQTPDYNMTKSTPKTADSYLSRASQKRRDPRRLTLTRSTTMEIEERFQALEKHLNNESLTQNKHPQRLEKLSFSSNNPSFLQTSLQKTIVRENFPDLSPQGNFVGLKRDILISPPGAEEMSLTTKPSISSLADLEERYERQMSASDKTEKVSLELKHNMEKKNEVNSGETKNESNNRSTEGKEEIKRSESGTQSKGKSMEGTRTLTPQHGTKTMPSTAELEERFDALEIDGRVAKPSPPESKKEPPDIKTRPQTAEVEAQSNNGKTEQDKKLPRQESVKEARDENEGESFEGDRVESTKKKTPPSTAELEKRFHALEKQMSTSIQRSDSHEKIEQPVKKTGPCLEDSLGSEKESNGREKKKPQSEKSGEQKKMFPREGIENLENYNNINKISGRRSSEPPSTEDLEKRYESLKRRMSSRNFTGKVVEQFECTGENLTETEREVLSERDHGEEHKSKGSMSLKSSEKPSDEDELKGEGSEKDHTPNKKSKKMSEEVHDTKEDRSHGELSMRTGVEKEDNENLETEKSTKVPEAPPLPLAIEKQVFTPPVAVSKERRALVKELETKIKSLPNEEFLKPSSLNPNRKPPSKSLDTPLLKTKDEISETHALTAFLQSESSEPLYGYSPKVVRRFSDVPSRADLENRLEFLEQKFYRKLVKQRCASDSEVTSRKALIEKLQKEEGPSCSMPDTSQRLEQRLQALEKQLSENSLKLLEAVRERKPNVPIEGESPSKPQPYSSCEDTIDATGKELVRYTHLGDFEESGVLKPINISINIKMTVDKHLEKQEEVKGKRTASDLEQRLDELEKQFKSSQLTSYKFNESQHPKPSTRGCENCVKDFEFSDNIIEKQMFLEKENNEGQELSKNEEKATEDETVSEKETSKVELGQESQSGLSDKTKSSVKSMNQTKEKTLEEDQCLLVNKPQDKTLEENDHERGKTDNNCENNTNKGDSEPSKVELKAQINVVKEDFETEKKSGKSEVTQKADCDAESPKRCTDENVKSEIAEECQTHLDTESKPSQNGKIKSERVDEELGPPKQSLDCPVPESVKKVGEQKEVNSCPAASNLDIGAVETSTDADKKTLVLLLDNEPKAVKFRRLTRANTEELENLFQALEKQLQDRNLIKTDDGKLKHSVGENISKEPTEDAKAISELTREIEEFTGTTKTEDPQKPSQKEQTYDWGPDPVKRHLKRKTVHLPSTKELEARFRSLERQIKLLEDVEKIDVEQRLHEIERKIKLQYSLAHEKDLTKYLELCEGKGLDDEKICTPPIKTEEVTCECGRRTPSKASQETSNTSSGSSNDHKSSRSPSRKKYSPSGASSDNMNEELNASENTVNRERSRSRHSTTKTKNTDPKKQPIHPLEMLLDPSPDDSNIPTTGELEHRIHVLEEKRRSPLRSKSSSREKIKQTSSAEEKPSRQSSRIFGKYDITPEKVEPPTEEELEARMRALEKDHVFDSKTQKNFKDFNEKLKNVISPSISFDETKIEKRRIISPERSPDQYLQSTSKSTLRRTDTDKLSLRSTSPKVLRFSEEDYNPSSSWKHRDPDHDRTVGIPNAVLNTIEENSKTLQRILKKTIAEPRDGRPVAYSSTSEGLDAMGSRLMRETSPLRRTGTHTGVPLRTGDNINDRLSSIKDTIKSIDSLCEDKPYQKEKCQRYIDSLFSDSVHFAHKKTSLDDLRSRSASRTRYSDYTPSIHVSDLSQRPSDNYVSRSIGSAESIRTTSPLPAASPLHYRSNRDLSRNAEISPSRRGRRSDEEREEYESRVRRDYMLPNSFLDNHSNLRYSGSSLTKFYKVDSQLEPYEREKPISRSPSRSPVRSLHDLADPMKLHNHSYTAPSTQQSRFDLDKPVSPYRQTTHNLLGLDLTKRVSTVYNPSKLEIRHTTVTSTFYDRLLTEKQLEKSLTRSASRSPVQTTTSFGDRNFMDTAPKTTSSSNDLSRVPYSSFPSFASTLTTQTTLHTTNTTTTGNSSYHCLPQNLQELPSQSTTPYSDFRIRICDNITQQFNSKSVTTAALTGSVELPTSIVQTTMALSVAPISVFSTTQPYLSNLTQPTTAATITTNLISLNSDSTAATNNISYINPLNSSILPTTTSASQTNFTPLLPIVNNQFTSTFSSTAIASTSITNSLISKPSDSTLSSHTSTTSGVSYPFMSSSLFQSLIPNKSKTETSSDSYTSKFEK